MNKLGQPCEYSLKDTAETSVSPYLPRRYVPEAAVQDPSTGKVTITAQKDGNGKITSAR